ncbi:MAG: hypothetical protein ABFC80_06390, partial [Coriobacteriales bacterium]
IEVAVAAGVLVAGIVPETAFGYGLWNYGYRSRSVCCNTVTNVSSGYVTPVSRAITAWNRAGTPCTFTGGSAPYANILYTRSYADAWRGLYGVKTMSNSDPYHRCTSFFILINRRICDAQSTNYKQSVVAHEIGHSYGLADITVGSALMNTNRNRNFIYTPQLDDKNGVAASWAR